MQEWSTRDLRARDQYSFWRDVLSQNFTPLVPTRTAVGHSAPIDSWVRTTPLGATNAAEVGSATQLLTHGRTEVARSSGEHVFVNLVVRGRCVVEQDGRRATVGAGGFSIVDATREFRQHYQATDPGEGWRAVSFRVDRDRIAPLLHAPQASTAVAHHVEDGGIARVVIGTMLSVWRNVDALDRAGAEAAEAGLLSMVAAACGGSDELEETRRGEADARLRAAINRHVVAHLRGSADLSASATAARFAISVRKLHALYQETGASYARTVMDLRVRACARDLESRGDEVSLSHLASTWGFCDLSHLNRAFRERYGCLPSTYRDDARG